MSIGAVLAVVLMDAIIYDIGLFKLPLWIAIPFTIFAVVGVTNAINIIDGFNGLAGGVSIIILSAFVIVSYIQGDQLILNISLFLIFAILGFLVCNFPRGKIFLGDGGAYFIGFMLAIISVLLVSRNSEVSPWFPLVVLAYPIFEVLFSIYRRKLIKGNSAFVPDGFHFHTLIFKRISRNNSKTSVHIWIFVAFFSGITIPFYSDTTILMIIFVLFSASYIYLYRSIVRFKTGEAGFETYLYGKKMVKNYLYRFLLLLIGHNWPKG
jgi:UDP-N-acetylmuramyl pentapeptide phosphotransferase/UDP-N-acetylglucosamine-1-phosphate transferase